MTVTTDIHDPIHLSRRVETRRYAGSGHLAVDLQDHVRLESDVLSPMPMTRRRGEAAA